jgi:uncharacterized membrane protein YqaE (UPF0057 family)
MVSEQLIAWAILIFGIALPAVHVVLARGVGGWAATSRCPFGPRLGWLIVVVFLPFAGWLLFVARRRKKANSSS